MDIVARSNYGQIYETEKFTETETDKDQDFESLLQNAYPPNRLPKNTFSKNTLSKNSSKTSYDISHTNSNINPILVERSPVQSSANQSSRSNSYSYVTDTMLHDINYKQVPGFFNWTYRGSIRTFFLLKLMILLFSVLILILLTITCYGRKGYENNWVELSLFLDKFLPDSKNVTDLVFGSNGLKSDNFSENPENTENTVTFNRFTATIYFLSAKNIIFFILLIIWIVIQITTDYFAVKSTFKNNWWQGAPAILIFLPNVCTLLYFIYDYFTHLQSILVKLHLVDYECSWKDVTVRNVVGSDNLLIGTVSKGCVKVDENDSVFPDECTKMCLGDLASIGSRNGLPGDLNCVSLFKNSGCMNEESYGYIIKVLQSLFGMGFLCVFVGFYIFNGYLLIGYGKNLQEASRRKHHASVAFE